MRTPIARLSIVNRAVSWFRQDIPPYINILHGVVGHNIKLLQVRVGGTSRDRCDLRNLSVLNSMLLYIACMSVCRCFSLMTISFRDRQPNAPYTGHFCSLSVN